MGDLFLKSTACYQLRINVEWKETGLKPEHLKVAAGQAAILVVGGCSTSPAQNMFGSFFPAWMLCVAVGILGAVVARQILIAGGIHRYVVAPPLTYLCIAVDGTLLVWLIWFGH
jgi:YtcA family